MEQTEKTLLTLDELREVLGIGRTTAYHLARRNELPVPVIRIGRRMFVSRAALEAVLQKQHDASA